MTDSFLTATHALTLLERGEVSSVELLDHYLDRIERLGGPINPFVTLQPERARDEARDADRKRANGKPQGPLHGLPMSVKDCFETAGLRTTCGFEGLADHVPQRDADAVARLRSAGAIIFGKTNLPTFAADGQSYNRIAGTTNNPWDLSRSPSGSSGGAAAALAMDFTPLELGSDIAGSIRLPAHACGVFGLKPSYGLVPLRGHIPGPPGSAAVADLNVAGPLARDAEDLELAFGLLAGPDDSQAKAWRLELPPPRGHTLGDYRILVWLDDEACRVDREVLEVLDAAVGQLETAGATLEKGSGPIPLADAIRVHRTLLMGVSCSGPTDEQFAGMVAAVQAGAGAGDDDAARHLRWLTQSKRAWNAVNEERGQMTRRWHEFFERYDALLCPVSPVAAIPHDHTPQLEARRVMINGESREYWDQVCWISMATACYLPAVSVPAGVTTSGLPVGLQIVAPHLEDRTALDLARLVAQVTGGFVPPPEPEPAAAPVAQA
jgi:amidase